MLAVNEVLQQIPGPANHPEVGTGLLIFINVLLPCSVNVHCFNQPDHVFDEINKENNHKA